MKRLRYALANLWTLTTPSLVLQTIGTLVVIGATQHALGERRGGLALLVVVLTWVYWRGSRAYRRLDALAVRERERQDMAHR